MKKSIGFWEVSLLLECPYCENYVDIDIPVEDGEAFNGVVECPECERKFIADVSKEGFY